MIFLRKFERRNLMSTQTITSIHTSQELTTKDEQSQYTLWQILGIWASVTLPMGLIYWAIVPALLSRGNTNPFAYLFLMNFGLVWQGILAYILLRREVKPFTWDGLKDRLWLHTPSNPRTGVRSKWLYLWTIPFIMMSFFGFQALGWLNDLWVRTIPILIQRPYSDLHNLAGPAVGQWWLLGVFAVELVFNYLLGEELIFRGILLPKMNGVFGKWDWVANHLLFVMYHLHMLWNTPSRLILDLLYPWPTKQFKSYWMGAIIHGADAIMFFYLVPMAIMGLFPK
jgi:membrane protease YdiL (CAAX protease family)